MSSTYFKFQYMGTLKKSLQDVQSCVKSIALVTEHKFPDDARLSPHFTTCGRFNRKSKTHRHMDHRHMDCRTHTSYISSQTVLRG